MTDKAFLKVVRGFIPRERIYTDELRRLAWGTDASEYRLVPAAVIRAADENEVSSVLREASRRSVPITFRAAGTSLSGQAVTESVLLVAGRHWEDIRYNEDTTVTMQPGVIGARVGRFLSRYGRRFGPDPASIASCMAGGIVSNNASGMSCGTEANSDRLLRSIRIVLAEGTVLDTGDEASREEFRRTHPGFVRDIEQLRDVVRADKDLAERIRHKYSIKNVTGLNLRPLIAYDDPFDIIAHLIVGSEGTLAFISEITMDTLPLPSYKASAMVYFPDIVTAAKAVLSIRHLKVSAAEILDNRSLRSVGDPHLSEDIPGLTALLCETEASSEEELREQADAIAAALAPFGAEVRFTGDPTEASRYWALRAGIFPTVGGMRKEGTTCLIEDVAFPLERLPEATADLSGLLLRHGYDDSCIYGHALAGNFHFIINQSFETPEEIARYDALIRDVAEMVVGKYDGSLKAEHGTGRNMAAFVEMEWGRPAFEAMKRIKRIFDPLGILNPGVIFNDDPQCYLKQLKNFTLLQDGGPLFREINKCIECGFCEVNCVSCGFTLSSRTRIAIRREIQRRKNLGLDYSSLEKAYRYPGERTCAGDGLCSTSCPMGINVADLTHSLRSDGIGKAGSWAGAWVARHFAGTKKAVRLVLGAAQAGRGILGDKAMASVCRGLHSLGIPLWTPSTPGPYSARDVLAEDKELKVVYFPSCINQTMGAPKGSRPLVEETVALLSKAGYQVIFPERMDSLCCGTIWESKGMPEIADRKTEELEQALWEASEHGRWPVLCDQSPCLHRMKEKMSRMQLYEPAGFIWYFLRDRLVFHPVDTPVAVHVTCSTKRMGMEKVIVDLARLCSTDVTVPEGTGCCAFAGDKGMTNPELNAYALRKLRPVLESHGVQEGYSNSRTCEIGLSHNGGIDYRSIVYLVNRVTTPKL